MIGVDTPLCHKSQSYVTDLILRGEAEMLPQGTFRRPAARLCPPKGSVNEQFETLVSAAHEAACNSAISNTEMEANVGIAETHGAMLRAQAKIKAWISPVTADEKAPLPRGKWYDSRQIAATVVQ